ncbi:hypothetical protein [Streptomyces sp. NPDC001222]|uniref:hypothetical protein n=1 Tax=Streptomyces sp. NPDC001222 TaxID=3364548 RepID=UPI0036A4B006
MSGTDMGGELDIKFSVSTVETPTANRITALEIAKLLNDFAASRGRPSIAFYGTPPSAPLN